MNAAIHEHAAYQIVLSHEKAFHSTLNHEDHPNIFGFIVKPHVPHACRENTSVLTIINIEPFSTAGNFISALFKPDKDVIIFKSISDLSVYLPGATPPNLAQIIHHIPQHNATRLDERVAAVIQHIQTHFAQKLNLTILSSLVHLSPSRLSALFKQETGSSLSRYILWTRIRQAIHLSLSAKDTPLSDIAFKTGFYDLPQLNKYMYEMIGVPPSGFRKNSDLIQVL